MNLTRNEAEELARMYLERIVALIEEHGRMNRGLDNTIEKVECHVRRARECFMYSLGADGS